MLKQRPKPEELLAKANEEERQLQLGKLKIFFGAAPGVGKTFSMLSEAISKRAEGLDVVIGLVESHGRKEIEELEKKLEILPRCNIEYRDKSIQEFDLDGAIKRCPALILVDEMAHTNMPGVRHTKRWRDIKELLDRGIDVYTTLNVQHIESLNDVIRQITGITVRETVPDSMLEMADSIELIDFPPEDLLKRLAEGKVYIPEQAELALQHFFRKANLTVLRELALRFTAERVNVEMQSERRELAETTTWPTSGSLLVCVDHRPFSIKLIRTTKRMANSFQSEWLAVFVDTPKIKINDEQRQAAIEHLRFAEQLGAKTAILNGEDIVKEIMEFSRQHNVTQIVIGKEIRSRFKEFIYRNLTNELIRISGEINVYIVTGTKENLKHKRTLHKKPSKIAWRDYFISCSIVGACTLINYILSSFLASANLIMIYLLGIVFIAARGRLGPSILASILSVLLYDLFFLPENMPFNYNGIQYVVTLWIMLLVAQVISHLTVLTKKQTEVAINQERKTSILHQLSRELASHRGSEELLKISVRYIAEIFNSTVSALLPDSNGFLTVRATSDTATTEIDAKERSIAQWVYDLGQMAGLGTDTLSFSSALYYPLKGATSNIGVLRIQPNKDKEFALPEQLHMLETIIQQIVLSIEVDRLEDENRKNQLEREMEGMRTILLNSISNELQVPLTFIQKLLHNVINDLDRLNTDHLVEQKKNIKIYSNQLNHLVTDFFQILRLEAGIIEPKKEAHSLQLIIKVTLDKLKSRLGEKTVNLSIPDDLPAVICDDALIGQVFVNIFDNAIRYTPSNTPIDVYAKFEIHLIEVSIADRGKGIAQEDLEQIFEKFYRGKTPPKKRGTGLGLSICRGIIHLHGGKIWGEQREGGGTIFKFTLPCELDIS